MKNSKKQIKGQEPLLKKEQVYRQLKSEILDGKRSINSRLPSEIALAKELGVGQITLRSALRRLEAESLIIRVQGKGTFIANTKTNASPPSTIMIIHDDSFGIESPTSYIMSEINRLSSIHDYKVFALSMSAYENVSDEYIKEFIKERNIIGIIIFLNYLRGNEPIIGKLQLTALPVVLAHANVDDALITGFSMVGIDELEAWNDAISYLADCGYYNIGIIGLTGAVFPYRHASKKGTLRQIALCGANPNPLLVKQSLYNRNDVYDIVAEFMQQKPRPEVILCYSDFIAMYVYDALDKLQLKIPEDIAVMGICGYPDAEILNPPLTNIDYGYSEIGKIAVEMVLDPNKSTNPSNGRGKIIIKPHKLIERQSICKQQLLHKEVSRLSL